MPKQTISTILGDRIENADYRDALPVNMYVVARNIRGSQGYLINQPGIVEFGDTPGVDRGGFYSSRFSDHFRVAGESFISIDAEGNDTTLGAVTGSLQADIEESFNNVCIVADEKVWYYNPTDGFRQPADSKFLGSIDSTFSNGVFLFTDGENLYHTTLLDEEVIEPLDFATSELSPDPTLAVATTPENQAMVFDRFTISYFFFTGSANFAYTRVTGKSLDVGIVGTQCQTELNGQFFILGGSREESLTMYQVSGTSKTKIATREIEKILAEYTEEELQTASLEARGEDGYQFIHVNLPNETLLFNYTIAQSLGVQSAWSILKTSITSMDGWLGINGIRDGRVKKWIYGDRFSARVGTLDNSVSTLYGEKVECIFYTPFIPLNGMSIDEIKLATISGFTDEKATVFVSMTENGETYGFEYSVDYGSKNQRQLRFEPRRWGAVDDFAGFKFRAVTSSSLSFGAMELTYG